MGYKISYAVRQAAPALGARGEKTAMLALLSYMADSAPDDIGKPKYGQTFNSVKTLAAHSLLHISWVRRLLRRAVAQGYVQPLGRTKYGTVIYKITAESFEQILVDFEAERNGVQEQEKTDSFSAFDLGDLDGSDD